MPLTDQDSSHFVTSWKGTRMNLSEAIVSASNDREDDLYWRIYFNGLYAHKDAIRLMEDDPVVSYESEIITIEGVEYKIRRRV